MISPMDISRFRSTYAVKQSIFTKEPEVLHTKIIVETDVIQKFEIKVQAHLDPPPIILLDEINFGTT
eukprot:CAMPEP_0176390242 /NCGR_PEP_ID=MMETSP0126-20121128/39014_1 /TAXON_ID=141414 ORGANISM="Strombidinopsis acuminatum, Strain SPMC142" /NCGR_SAMPLE_ID=MMETSP0126 /ASSEMBLY_ACC=CAM_ASM_000229 /LENGTH=66 /DNA_ID=CAMNT_0017759527 /DNA_START=84 /DNA_END=284 /DNA_ORIENTATION=+